MLFKNILLSFSICFPTIAEKFNLWCRLKLNYEVTLIIQTEFIIFQDSIVSTVISSTCLLFCSSFTCFYQSSSYDKLSWTFSLLYSKLLRQMRYLKIIYALLNTFSWKKKTEQIHPWLLDIARCCGSSMLKSCVIFTVEIYHASTIVYFSLFRRSSFSNHSASDSHYLAVCIARNQREKILF